MPARTTKKKTTKKKTTRAKTTGLVKHKITLGKGDDPGDIRVSKTVTYNTRGVFGGNKTVQFSGCPVDGWCMISVGCNRLDVSSIHIPGLDNVGKIKLIIEILTEMLHEVESAKTSVVLFNKLLALPPAEREKVLTKAVEAAK